MNRLRMTVLLAVMVLALMVARPAQAQEQCPWDTPPTPSMLAEINATHGAALLKYCPQYATYSIPVTGTDFYFRHHTPPSAEMLIEIEQTHGLALMDYWKK